MTMHGRREQAKHCRDDGDQDRDGSLLRSARAEGTTSSKNIAAACFCSPMLVFLCVLCDTVAQPVLQHPSRVEREGIEHGHANLGRTHGLFESLLCDHEQVGPVEERTQAVCLHDIGHPDRAVLRVRQPLGVRHEHVTDNQLSEI